MRGFLSIRSLEFINCSEETRAMGRRILFGRIGPLGGCGVLLFIDSFDGVSGVSQSETKANQKKKYRNDFSYSFTSSKCICFNNIMLSICSIKTNISHSSTITN